MHSKEHCILELPRNSPGCLTKPCQPWRQRMQTACLVSGKALHRPDLLPDLERRGLSWEGCFLSWNLYLFFGPQFLQSLVLVSSYLNYNVDCFLFACAFKSYCYTKNTDADRWESRFSFLSPHLLFRQIFVVTGALKVAVILYFLVCSLER